MKNKLLTLAVALGASVSAPTYAQTPMFSGDTKLACEAVLCLAGSAMSGSSPSACVPPIRRYFMITATRPWKLFQARLDFLNLCPSAGEGTAYTIVQGAGNCDSAALNSSLRVTTGGGGDDGGYSYISDSLPSYCTGFFKLVGSAAKVPRYAGDQWVEPEQYDAAMAAYNQRLADAAALAQQQQNQGGGSN
jgi:TrbM